MTSLLIGTNPSRKCLGNVIEAWRKVKLVISKLCSEDVETITVVMKKILGEHADSAHRTYHLLLQVSKSPGMCKVRAPALLSWVEKLEQDAWEFYEILRKDMMIENMQQALVLNTKMRITRKDDGGDEKDDNDFDA